MRWIAKPDRPPESIRIFLERNLPVGVNLDYRNAPLDKGKLLKELVADQGGLCAYTGVAIDERLRRRQSAVTGDGLVYYAHNEHLKPQSLCRQELLARGLEPGRVLGDDMDHRNIVAALGVRGSQECIRELFGATARKPNATLPVLPTEPECGSRFRYLANGEIEGLDEQAGKTIDELDLNHPTLVAWRSEAWGVFEAHHAALLAEDEGHLLARILEPDAQGSLLEFAFVLEDVWRQLGGEAGSEEAR